MSSNSNQRTEPQVANATPLVSSPMAAVSALLLFLFSGALPGSGIDLLKYELRDLNSGEVVSLDHYRGDITVIMFFEPDCPFCFKQSKILDKLQAECSDFQALAVGVNGNRNRLQEELRRIKPKFPAYQVSRALQKDIGKVEGTPLILIGNKKGEFHTHLRGFQQMNAMLPILASAGLTCSS